MKGSLPLSCGERGARCTRGAAKAHGKRVSAFESVACATKQGLWMIGAGLVPPLSYSFWSQYPIAFVLFMYTP